MMDTIKKINNVLRIIIITLLLITAWSVTHFKFGDCDKCSFNIKDKTYSKQGFLDLYFDKCFTKAKNLFIPLGFDELSPKQQNEQK